MSEPVISIGGDGVSGGRHEVVLKELVEELDVVLSEVISDVAPPRPDARDLVDGWCPDEVEVLHSLTRSQDGQVLDHRAVLRTGDVVASFRWWHSGARVEMYAEDPADVEHALLQALLENVPREVPPGDRETTPLVFWRMGRDGPQSSVRDLECPAWAEVEENYPGPVREGIEELVTAEEPESLGRIVLWHGASGVGKTYAVRALAREWTERLDATVEVILDQEVFFGNTSYLHDVLLETGTTRHIGRRIGRRRGEIPFPGVEMGFAEAWAAGEKAADPLRLFVIEGAASLFAVGCRDRRGFSRFLDVTDGLAGQGVRSVFLLTASQPVQQVDPAVHRPGRCIQDLPFERFSPTEATEWLERHGEDGAEFFSDRDREEVTLAELYAHLHGRPLGGGRRRPSRVGFGP